MTSFSFGAPELLTGLVIPLIAAVALWYAVRERRAVARRLGGPPRLRTVRGEGVRVLLAVLVILAAALAVLAAARPQWGETEAEVRQSGIDLVIALDVSRSMEAQDVPPSRAEAAASGLTEMLTHMAGNRVGLVVFAGTTFPRAPLTVDLGVVSSLVARAQAEAPLVRPGTNIREALSESFRILDVEDPARARAIVLVSDGEDLGSDFQQAVDFASRRGIRIYTVFAGTANPTPLPEESGGTDVSIAQPEVLEAIATATGASFRPVDRIPGLAVEFRRLQQTEFGDASETQPIERFTWFAGAAALLLLLAVLLGEGASTRLPRLRRGVITAAFALLAGLVLVGCGTAAWRHIEEGNAAYAQGEYEEALQAYRAAADSQPEDPAINYNIANALHQLRRYDEAAVAAEQSRVLALEQEDGALAARALFTTGNTAFLRQDFEAARDAYRAALRIDPTDRDVKANLELVLAILQPPPPEPAEQPGAGAGEGEEEPGEGSETGGEGEPSEGPGAGSPGEEPGEQPGGESTSDGSPSPGPPSPGSPGAQPGSELTTLEDVQTALQEALGELGPEVSLEEALRILELSRRANELDALPREAGGGVPPR